MNKPQIVSKITLTLLDISLITTIEFYPIMSIAFFVEAIDDVVIDF